MLTARSLALPRPAAARRPRSSVCAATSHPPPAHSLASRSLRCVALRRSLAARSAAGSAVNSSEADDDEGVTSLASLAPKKTAAQEFAVLKQFSEVHWTEMIGGCFFVLMMAETLRFVVEGAAALPFQRLLAGALVALSVDFSQRAYMQLRGARMALAQGRQVRRFQACVAAKASLEVAGLYLAAVKSLGGWGCALALSGHALFHLVNTQSVSFDGAVKEIPQAARRGIASIDAALAGACARAGGRLGRDGAMATYARFSSAGLCAASALLNGPYSLAPASLVALFAVVYMFDKYVRKTKHE